MNTTMTIEGRQIGPGHPTYVIAELSANHRQDYAEAEKLVRAAKDAGADAVKLQTYTPDTITIPSDLPMFRHGAGSLWEGRSLHELYQEAYTPWEWQPKLKRLAEDLGLACFSTPFDPTAVDFLESMNVPAYKIASFEIIDLPLIRQVARLGKPMIVSTGMATLAEIDEAVTAAREAGCDQLALLKCTSAYPSPPGQMHLRTIPHLAETFGVPAGLSDHTLGIAAAVAAVALGACIIEKHFTLSRADKGPDSAFSLEPQEFRRMVDEVRIVEEALGEVHFGGVSQEQESKTFRRSLFIVEDVRAGEPLTAKNVRSIRPGYGLAPKFQDVVLGRVARRDLQKGTPLTWDVLL